jgi:hypothetical protein
VITKSNSLPEKVITIAEESAASGLSEATIARQRRLKADHPASAHVALGGKCCRVLTVIFEQQIAGMCCWVRGAHRATLSLTPAGR